VWIERVALEHHRDIAVLRRHVIHDAVADEDAAIGNLFEACKEAQAGGLAAARRADKHQEFLIRNGEVEVIHGDHITVALVDVFVGYTGHECVYSLYIVRD